MGELEEKLETILGNPQAMAQIMSLAQSLSQGGQGQEAQSQPPPQGGQDGDGQPPPASPAPPPASPGGEGGGGGLGGLLGALGGLDSGTLSAAASLIGQFSGDGGDDKRTALLAALRPYVRAERYAKLDKAIQIAKLSRLIRSGLELLRARKEDGHV